MSIMQLVGFLSDDEADLVRETEVERMAQLDEDDLLALHTRVRRARTKYVKLYRRQASARVEAKGARGTARPANRRNADKAEVFELALARVSKRVDVVARAAAAELKAERLAAAKAAKGWAIGVDSDQALTAAEDVRSVILTSMLKRVDVGVYDFIKSVHDGAFKAGPKVFDLKADGVGFSTTGGNVDDIADKLNEYREQIISGAIVVPDSLG